MRPRSDRGSSCTDEDQSKETEQNMNFVANEKPFCNYMFVLKRMKFWLVLDESNVQVCYYKIRAFLEL